MIINLVNNAVKYTPVGSSIRIKTEKRDGKAFVSVADDVMCISDHYAVLGRYTARVLRGLLGGEMRPRKRYEWKG